MDHEDERKLNEDFLNKYNAMIWLFVNEIIQVCKYLDKEDVYQSLVYKLLLIRKKIDKDKGNEINYVYKVLQNEAIYVKRQYFSSNNKVIMDAMMASDKYENELDGYDILNEFEDEYFNPERYLYENIIKNTAKEIFDSFSEKHQRVISMFFIEGYNINDISKIQKMSKKNAYTIIKKYTEKLLLELGNTLEK